MRSFNSVSRRSEARKGGEPISHVTASLQIANYVLKKYGTKYEVQIGRNKRIEWFSEHFIRMHKLRESGRTFMAHEYDVTISSYKELLIRSWNYIKLAYIDKISFELTPDFFVEVGDVGDDTKHNPGHKSQLIDDGIGQSWVEYRWPDAKYVKINKDDCAYNSEIEKKLGI